MLLWNVLLTKYWGIFTVHFVFIIKYKHKSCVSLKKRSSLFYKAIICWALCSQKNNAQKGLLLIKCECVHVLGFSPYVLQLGKEETEGFVNMTKPPQPNSVAAVILSAMNYCSCCNTLSAYRRPLSVCNALSPCCLP